MMLSLRQHQIDSFFHTFKLVCSKIDYAEQPIDKLFLSRQCFYYLKFFDILDWLAFTGVQITSMPSDFYLGSALSVLVRSWNAPGDSGWQKMHRELARKLVIAGADLHYRDSHARTLLQTLVACSPMQTAYQKLISEWLSLLDICGIDVQNYVLQETHFSKLEPFEIDTQLTLVAARPSLSQHFIPKEMYTCIHLRTIGLEFDDMGCPIPKVLRWVDPKNPAALVLEEFSFCVDLIILLGDDCNRLGIWITSWKHSIYRPSAREKTLLYRAGELSKEIHCQHLTFCTRDSFGNYLELWPFNGSTHTLCQTGDKLHQPCLGPAGKRTFREIWCEIHKCTFNHARFERKQARKIAKRRKQEGKRVVEFPMPGAWPDKFFLEQNVMN